MSDCPFYTKGYNPSFFVERQKSLQILCDRLKQVESTSINIVGEHYTGKSALLKHFVNTYEQRLPNPDLFMVICLSLQNAACRNQEKFYQRIAQLLEEKVASNGNFGQLRRKLTAKKWDIDKFNDLVQAFKEQNILPVLCIDNFEELLERQEEFPNGFYDNLRYLVSNNFLMIVMAYREMLDIYCQQKQITSDFFNVFQLIDLNKGLTEAEAQTLVRFTNSAGQGLSYHLQEKALNWGKQHPLMLQLAGQTLWEVQFKGKTLKWAEETFKTQSKRFYIAPKSPLLSTLYKMIRKLGAWILWYTENQKGIKEFWVGLIFLAIVFAILIAFTYRYFRKI